jgi:adenylate kinase
MKENARAIVLLGPPGSGKTTLARLLAERNHISVIETGNLLEKEIQRGTELGRQIKPYKIAGELVPSELVKRVISSAVKNFKGDLILFDGFPRSPDQLGMLFELLKEHHLDLGAVIFLTVDLETVLERLSGRRICGNCGTPYHLRAHPPRQPGICDRCGGPLIQRQDDRPEVVQERFKNYERSTLPVVDFFTKEYPEVTRKEPAMDTPDEVAERVWQWLEEAVLHEKKKAAPLRAAGPN